MKVYTTILAIPDQRLEPSDKPVVLFSETPAGTPAAIKAWFYPGDTIGDEFVYPRSEAMRIAQATHKPVLSRSDESSDMKSSEVSRIDESGNKVAESEHAKADERANAQPPASTTTESAASSQNANQRPNADQNKAAVGTSGTTAPGATDQPKAQPRSAASNRPAGQANSDQSDPNARRHGALPKTASPLALYELVSGLAFAGAFGIRQLRNRL
jgi:hypothetical protein